MARAARRGRTDVKRRRPDNETNEIGDWNEKKTMTTKEKRAEDRQALEHLLEVYGADRTRWPARERLRFASLVAEDDGARRLVSEASALDSLLDLAPKASAAREHALKERIVAAALRQTEPRFAVVARSTEPARARMARLDAAVHRRCVRRRAAAGLQAGCSPPRSSSACSWARPGPSIPPCSRWLRRPAIP